MKALKFIAVAAVAAALAVSCNTSSNPKVDVELPTSADIDSVSYLIGVNFGSFIKGNNFAAELSELNMSQIKKGMEDFLKADGDPYSPEFGKQFKIDLDRMGEILNGYLTKKKDYEAAVNLAKEKEFLSKNAKKADVDTTASGLQYTIISAGAEEKVAPQDTVWVNYKGTLLDGTVFDQNDSTKFVANRVIKGWTEALCLMPVGSKWELYIPYQLAYGERDMGTIKPYSALIFTVELLGIEK